MKFKITAATVLTTFITSSSWACDLDSLVKKYSSLIANEKSCNSGSDKLVSLSNKLSSLKAQYAAAPKSKRSAIQAKIDAAKSDLRQQEAATNQFCKKTASLSKETARLESACGTPLPYLTEISPAELPAGDQNVYNYLVGNRVQTKSFRSVANQTAFEIADSASRSAYLFANGTAYLRNGIYLVPSATVSNRFVAVPVRTVPARQLFNAALVEGVSMTSMQIGANRMVFFADPGTNQLFGSVLLRSDKKEFFVNPSDIEGVLHSMVSAQQAYSLVAYQIMRGMLSLQHDTALGVIANIGGNTVITY